MTKYFLSLLICLALASCRSASQPTGNTEAETIAKNSLGKDAIISYNKDKSFSLCYKERGEFNITDYIIIRTSDGKVVEKSSVRGSVTWEGDMAIKEMTIPGMEKKDSNPESHQRIIDLKKYLIIKS